MIGNLKVLIEKEIPKITNPKRELEQYSTPSELILDMIQDSYLSGLLENSITMDLGAGTCRIAIASLLMGALKSIALEIDDRFYHDCMGSVKKFNLEGRLIFIKTYVNKNLGLIKEGSIDIIFMNPPFGIWKRNADTEFLEFAFSKKPNKVYSILKSGNISYHTKLSSKWGYRLRLIKSRKFPIVASMAHHRSRIRRVKVDVILFER